VEGEFDGGVAGAEHVRAIERQHAGREPARRRLERQRPLRQPPVLEPQHNSDDEKTTETQPPRCEQGIEEEFEGCTRL